MKKLLLLVIALLLSTGLSALPTLSDVLGPNSEANAETLLAGEPIHLFQNTEPVLLLLPQGLFSSMIRSRTEQLNPNMAIEGLYFIPKENPTEEDLLEILNILCRVSTLQGLEYYSASRDEMRLLFEECYAMDNLEDRNIQEDPQFQELPPEVELWIHQKDLTFYHSDSLVRIYSDVEALLFEQINQTPMRYNGMIRVIRPENFQTRLMILPCQEGILYYAVMAADTLNVQMFKERANNSFYNRMAALFGWFQENYLATQD